MLWGRRPSGAAVPASGASVLVVLPWFFPVASLVAWLGLRSARDFRAEGRPGRRNAVWMAVLLSLPLLIWLVAQFAAQPGDLP